MPSPLMRVALFDLDHTLVPFDTGMAWTRFLIAQGRLDPGFEAYYLGQCQRYVDGSLDIQALHRTMVGTLAAHPRATLDAWLEDFEADVAARLPAAARALVDAHRAAGEACVLVTATTHFLAERVARGFGLDQVLATVAQERGGRFTGEIDGLPCYREHKVDRVEAWLAARGQSLASVAHSVFYSDSASDLPLLEAVREPVAVRPDARLKTVAQARGWRVIPSLAD